MSGGPTAIKGFQAQTLVAMLESLELGTGVGTNNPWTAVTIEPKLEGGFEKVDILWQYKEGGRRAVQVKSTGATFSRAEVVQWAGELERWDSENTRYQVVLVGGVAATANCLEHVEINEQRRAEIVHYPEGLAHLNRLRLAAAAQLQLFYLNILRVDGVDIETAQRILDGLDSQYLQRSANQNSISRDSLIAYLRGWVPPPAIGFRTIRVFLAVAPELQNATAAVDDAISSLNRTYRNRLQLELQRFDWNDDHPAGSFQPNLVVDGQPPVHDLYLAVVSSRLAETAPRAGEASTTGLRQALEKWQNSGPGCFCLVVDSQAKNYVDLDQDDEVAAYKTVQKIRQSPEFAPFVKTYESTDRKSLPLLLQEHLSGILNRIPVATRLSAAGGAGPTDEPPVPATIPPAYIIALQTDCADVRLTGLKPGAEAQAVRLKNVYVPALTTRPQSDQPEKSRPRQVLDRDEADRFETLLSRFNRESLYVSGAPGLGKSTLCRWIAWLVLEGNLPVAEIPAPENYREEFPSALRGRLPLLVELREFYQAIPKACAAQEKLNAQSFLDWLLAWVDTKQFPGVDRRVVEAHLRQGTLLLLLDGVDEIPTTETIAGRTVGLRQLFLTGLSAAAPGWIRQQNRLLLTSRPYGLTDAESRGLGFPDAAIAPLLEELQVLLVRRWFTRLCATPAEGEEVARQLLAAARSRDDLTPLCDSPMLLTALCIVYRQGKGGLPHDRFELYDRIVDSVLCNKFQDDRKVIAPIRNRLAVIAHAMHTGEGLPRGGRAAKGVPQWTIPVTQIETLIEQYQGAQKSNDQTYTTAVNATNQLLNSSGLLLPRENFAAGFYHATIQDFLAAQRLWSALGRDPARLDQFFRERAPQPEWRGTLNFLMGWQIQAQGDEVEESFELLTRLIQGLKPLDVGLGVVIGQCLQILSKRGRDLKDAGVLETYRQFCKDRIAESVEPLRDRYELGLALGALGDDRMRVNLKDRQDKTGFVRIPAGTYRVGEPPRELVLESDLWLTQYPITNSQFAEFIHDGGYTTPALWSPDGGRQWLQQTKSIAPRWWHDVKWNAPNKPVVGVTWYEADAFARWAGGRLPTEWEWEAAARGPEGWEYPWGNEWEDGICNSDEAGLGTTSTVGLFPKSRSRETGLDDMAGNVWEWCENWFDKEASIRVVRGGSWYFSAAWCRSAYRDWFDPDYRRYYLGFRVALSSIPAAQPPS